MDSLLDYIRKSETNVLFSEAQERDKTNNPMTETEFAERIIEVDHQSDLRKNDLVSAAKYWSTDIQRFIHDDERKCLSVHLRREDCDLMLSILKLMNEVKPLHTRKITISALLRRCCECFIEDYKGFVEK